MYRLLKVSLEVGVFDNFKRLTNFRPEDAARTEHILRTTEIQGYSMREIGSHIKATIKNTTRRRSRASNGSQDVSSRTNAQRLEE
jgi:hypothetical protein